MPFADSDANEEAEEVEEIPPSIQKSPPRKRSAVSKFLPMFSDYNRDVREETNAGELDDFIVPDNEEEEEAEEEGSESDGS